MRFLFIAFLGLFSASVWADDAQTKQDDIARTQLIQNGIKACGNKGFKTLGEKDQCIAEFTDKANDRYPVRGSDSYSRKHYAGMSKAKAEATLQQLQREWESAPRGGFYSARRQPGVVSKKAIAEEGWWIQVNVLGAQQSQDDPWFIECNDFKTANILRRCPLGKGGEK